MSSLDYIPSPELRKTVKTYSTSFYGGSVTNQNILDVNYMKTAFRNGKITNCQFANLLKSCVVTNSASVLPSVSVHRPNGYPNKASCSQAILEPLLNLVFLNTVNKASSSRAGNRAPPTRLRQRSKLQSDTAIKWYLFLGLGILTASGITSVVGPKILSKRTNNAAFQRRSP